MKRILYSIVAVSMIFFSCSKHNNPTPPPTGKKYTVKFNVGFSQSIGPITNSITKTSGIKTDAIDTATDTLKNYTGILYYVVFDSNQHIVRNISQKAADADYGTITDQLLPGTYTVLFAAGEAHLKADVYGSAGQLTNAFYYEGFTSPYVNPNDNFFPPFFANTFYKKMSITVGNSNANYSVNLDRMVAQLEVVVQDAIPAGAKDLTIYVPGDASALAMLDLTVANTGNYFYPFTGLTAGVTNTIEFVTVANTSTPLNIELKCTDGASTVFADKTITGVTFKTGSTTVLTGNLFSAGTTGQGFNVTYDPTWNVGTPTTIHF